MSDITLSGLDDVQTKYQPRLVMRPEDSVNSDWKIAVYLPSDHEEEDELFDTSDEAYQAGIEFIYEISDDSEAIRRNFKRFRIVRITWEYVPFPSVVSKGDNP